MSKSSYGFIGLAMRQHLIRRWSLMRCVSQESVLEHSASVGLLVTIAGHLALQNGRKVNIEQLMGHALVHDMSEVLCSDIVTPVKNATPALRAEFMKLEKVAEEHLLSTLPVPLKDSLGGYFTLTGYERTLFKACDTYAAMVKCKLEIAAGNGGEFQQAYSTLSASLDEIKEECPEIAQLDALFGEKIGVSIDQLLASEAAPEAP